MQSNSVDLFLKIVETKQLLPISYKHLKIEFRYSFYFLPFSQDVFVNRVSVEVQLS